MKWLLTMTLVDIIDIWLGKSGCIVKMHQKSEHQFPKQWQMKNDLAELWTEFGSAWLRSGGLTWLLSSWYPSRECDDEGGFQSFFIRFSPPLLAGVQLAGRGNICCYEPIWRLSPPSPNMRHFTQLSHISSIARRNEMGNFLAPWPRPRPSPSTGSSLGPATFLFPRRGWTTCKIWSKYVLYISLSSSRFWIGVWSLGCYCPLQSVILAPPSQWAVACVQCPQFL